MATKTSTATKESRRADRVVTTNRRAGHEYFIEETIEAGIALQGTEIKSIRDGKISISEAYARIDDGELWLIGANISPYTHGSYTNHDPDRRRNGSEEACRSPAGGGSVRRVFAGGASSLTSGSCPSAVFGVGTGP